MFAAMMRTKAEAVAGGGMFRRLAVPFSGFVLAASLALVGWLDWSHRQEALRSFAEMAAANARMVDRLRLPRSPELARNLADVLGVGVGFRFAGQAVGGLPAGLEAAVDTLAGTSANSTRVGGRDVAVAPLADGSAHLVLVRDGAGLLRHPAGWLLPALIVTSLGGGLAFLVARRLVNPLAALSRWLPHLDRDAPEPIPAAVTGRADEIGVLARSLEEGHRRLREEQALRRQSERLATLGRIATSLAHEIRNPAAAIRLHADLLAARGDEPGVELIREEVDRITDLVNQWLFVAKAAPARRERHDLVELTRRVIGRLTPQLDHAGVTVAWTPADPVPVMVDGPRIEQVLRNLLVNAAQVMPLGGRIELSLHPAADGPGAVLEIRDGGPGFSEAARVRWREPFFSEREGGMGLGLTLAAEVMEAHGGSVEVDNIPGGGAVVRCRFPDGSE